MKPSLLRICEAAFSAEVVIVHLKNDMEVI
jgi:hypothetical protein